MLGKLCKHEFKASIRVCGLMYLVVAIFTGMSMIYEALFRNVKIQNEWMRRFVDSLVSMGGIGYLLVLVAVNLLTLVYLIYRFYQTMVGDQGYLTHTLPVTTGQLIFVKTITAFCLQQLSFLVSLFSVFLLLVSMGESKKIVTCMDDMMKSADDIGLWGSSSFAVLLVLIVLFYVFSALFKILEYYTCLGAGNLFDSHKLAGSVVIYLVFCVLLGIAKTFVMMIGMYAAEKWTDALFEETVLVPDIIGAVNVYMAAGVLLMAVGCVLLFAVSRYLLKDRLNLA